MLQQFFNRVLDLLQRLLTVTGASGFFSLTGNSQTVSGSGNSFSNSTQFSSLVLTGTVTTYNNVATAGLGVAAIYATYSQTGKIAAVTNAINYTPPATAGRYRLSWTVTVTTSTLHSFTVLATWKDASGNARSQVIGGSDPNGTSLVAGAITNVIGVGSYYGVCYLAIDNSATAITLSTSGTFTTVTYNLSSSLEQLA